MTIAIFIKALSIGGAEKQSLLLTRELQRSYPAFLVVWSSNRVAPRYQSFIETHKINVIFLKGIWLVKIMQLVYFLKKEKVNYLFNLLLINNFVGGLAGRLAGVPNIFGGIRNCEIVPRKLAIQRWLHNHVSHKTIFNNHAGTINLSRQGFKKTKMIVIHNGTDVEMAHCKQSDSLPVVLFTAARFLPQKDHFTALSAMQILKERGLNFRYVMAGYGDQEEKIRQWISEMGLEDHVELKIAPKNLSLLFGEAHIYISTSLKEGLSNSIMEALSAGLPVVATNVGDNNYLVRAGENGYLVPVKAPAEMADAVEKLVRNVNLRKVMGDSGFELLKNNFSARRFLKNYLKLIENDEKTNK